VLLCVPPDFGEHQTSLPASWSARRRISCDTEHSARLTDRVPFGVTHRVQLIALNLFVFRAHALPEHLARFLQVLCWLAGRVVKAAAKQKQQSFSSGRMHGRLVRAHLPDHSPHVGVILVIEVDPVADGDHV
jgi:hypothetical protein